MDVMNIFLAQFMKYFFIILKAFLALRRTTGDYLDMRILLFDKFTKRF